MLTISVNGRQRRIDADPATPLLWVLRDVLSLTGTKYGCGKGLCGACTVHLDGRAVRSCQTPVSSAAGKKITTIEQAWIAEAVPQCGYCQPGMVMSAAALLARTPKPSDADIDSALAGHVCRCGTYQRIRQAIHRAAEGAKA